MILPPVGSNSKTRYLIAGVRKKTIEPQQIWLLDGEEIRIVGSVDGRTIYKQNHEYKTLATSTIKKLFKEKKAILKAKTI